MAKDKWSEIVGASFTFLNPIRFFPKSKQSGEIKCRPFWICLCRCNRFVKASTTDLKKKRVISCALCRERAEKTLFDGWADDLVNDTRRKHLTRTSYDCMIGRPHHAKTYRSITICPQWQGADGFEHFVKDVGLRRHGGLTLERKDPHGNYTPENCIWADDSAQRRNKTNSVQFKVEGELMNLCDLAAAVHSTSTQVRRKVERMVQSGLTEDEAAERVMADWRMKQYGTYAIARLGILARAHTVRV